MTSELSAAVIGSGPNGLAAAVTLARAGVPVTVFEAADTIGGGMRTSELVAPGILHDECSAIHPLALATGFFRAFGLAQRIDFATPEASYAHPLDGRPAAIAFRDLAQTVDELGRDGRAYRRLIEPLVTHAEEVVDFAFGGSMIRLPKSTVTTMKLMLRTLEQGSPLWNARFHESSASALLTGAFAHNISPMPKLASAAIGLILATLGHTVGWPVPIGGSRAIADALAADLIAHGGRIETGREITDARKLGNYGVRIYDTSPQAFASIERESLPISYAKKLKGFRSGNGVCTVEFVLDGPIPWSDERIAAAPTVHLGGSRAEIAASEREIARGQHAARPFVLLTQPALFDPSRNAEGVHAISAYAHVPHGSARDVSSQIIAQIVRFAPGFRDRIRAMRVTTASELATHNPNYVGGDIAGGATSLSQLIARPIARVDPWRTPAPGRYLASASTAPGPGVHGLAGWYAARSALRHEYGLPDPDLSTPNSGPSDAQRTD